MKKHFLKDEYIKECIVGVKKEDKLIFDKLSDFFGKLFLYKKDVVYVDNNTFAFVTKTDIKSFLFTDETLGIFWERDVDNKGRLKEDYNINVDKVFAYAKLNRLDNIVFEGVARGEEYVKLDYDARTLIVGVKNLFLREKIKQVDEKIKQEIIKDYKEHFPQLDEVLDFIVACRFSNNRKRSFLYLNAPSDWGKSFFMSIFKDLNVAVEVNYGYITKEGPIGLSAMKLLKSLVLFLDEFTVFKKEMKKITHNMTVEEKFMPAVEVPIYAKILMSAEKSNSFSDTVETQIINRVIMIEINSDIVLTDRELYKKYGNLMYFEAVKSYIFEFLEKKINYYLSLDEFEADKQAEEIINNLYNKYKITAFDLETYLIGFFADELNELLRNKVLEENAEKNGRVYNNDFENIKLLKYIHLPSDRKKYSLYISNFTKFVDELFDLKLDSTKKKTAEYKKTQIINILFGVKKLSDIVKQKKIKGINKKVAEVDISDLYLKYILKIKRVEIAENEIIIFDTLEELAEKINEVVRNNLGNEKKLSEIKENLGVFGLLKIFILVKDSHNGFLGVQYKDILPPDLEIPF